MIKVFSIRYDGTDSTKILCNCLSIVVLLKNSVGVYWYKQKETYEKFKNRGWYSKWYWYFINATTTTDNNDNDDNTPASTVTATVTTNKSNNNSNNYNSNSVIIIEIIITKKSKIGCELK